jgi:uncharacterized protein (TIGR04255 family)
MAELTTDHLPTYLENCPIVDAVVEIRFSSGVARQAIFGIAYNALSDYATKIEELPITQLPQAIIDNDPNLKFKPHYRLTGDSQFAINIGPDVLNVSPLLASNGYPGWEKFYDAISKVYSLLQPTKVIGSVRRLGIRYTNFFNDLELFHKLNLDVRYNKEALPYKKTLIRTEIELGGFQNTLQVSNDATRQEPKKAIQYGSIIDIDTHKNYNEGTNLEFLLKDGGDISAGHDVEKILFWNLLNEKFKTELKPHFN